MSLVHELRSASACCGSSAISVGSPSRGKDDGVISLHAPIIREIENIVGRAADQRGEILIFHQGANAIEFRFVYGPSHSRHCTESCSIPFNARSQVLFSS